MDIVGFGAEVLKSRKELKIAEIDAKAKRFADGQIAEKEWEAMAAQNAATSWLDEYWTLILSIPLILCFIPGMESVVREGFSRLAEIPDWYIWSIGASISFAFARRSVPLFFKGRGKTG
ncbi:MAG: hypothetical protein MK098_12955 [Marinovum sp.]|nr:hypothetical protein [Marinovum sp.]